MSSEIFEIYEVAGFNAGTLALCRQPYSVDDFVHIDGWRPTVVVTLTTEEEFHTTEKSLPEYFLEAPFDWLHMPITDFGIPEQRDEGLWQEMLSQLQDILNANGRILVHCKGGRGRSGMLLLKLLTLQGEDGETALQRIRTIRAKAVETDVQYSWATKAL